MSKFTESISVAFRAGSIGTKIFGSVATTVTIFTSINDVLDGVKDVKTQELTTEFNALAESLRQTRHHLMNMIDNFNGREILDNETKLVSRLSERLGKNEVVVQRKEEEQAKEAEQVVRPVSLSDDSSDFPSDSDSVNSETDQKKKTIQRAVSKRSDRVAIRRKVSQK